jgi:hypothetical protein
VIDYLQTIAILLLLLVGALVFALWLYRLSWLSSIRERTSGFAAAHWSLIHYCAAGQSNGFPVKVSQTLYESITESLLVDVDARGHIPPDLELGSETAKTRTQGQDIVTEDQLFDHAALVFGSEVSTLAILDHGTRNAVLDLLARGGLVTRGQIRAYCSSQQLSRIIPELTELAGSLSLRKSEIPDRLVANIKNDCKPEVRARNFIALQQHFAGTEAAEQAAEIARTSTQPHLRIEAAIFDQDHVQLCEIASDREYPGLLRVRAVERLTRASWAEVAIPVLMQLLDDESPQVQKAAATGLGRFRHRPAVARLVEMATSIRADLVRDVAEALGRIGDPAAEATLVGLLKHSDEEVFEAAVKALGRAGAVSAVEPLLEVAESLTSSSERDLVEESIRRIQSRLAGAGRGQLSIAVPEEPDGRLSLAGETVDGGVSLVSNKEPEASTE